MSDSELQAMSAVADALDQLDDPARTRVLRWAAERFGADVLPPAASGGGDDTKREAQVSYEDVGDLVHAASPATGLDYALAVAYWIQIVEGKATWAGIDVNNVLKDLGHGLSNVTKTLKSLMNRKPALVMQTAKSGRSRQARKSYKLTAAGVSHVQTMLSGGGTMSPEEARKRLESAIEVLKDVDLPDHLEVVAFERLLDAYGLASSQQRRVGDGPKLGLIQQAEQDEESNGADGALAVIAQKLHSDLRSVAQIYDMQDGGVQLILRRDMLPDPTKKAVSMRHVGLLVVAGRQAAGIEEWTALGTLRDECREIGVLDSSNFSTEIGKLGLKVKGAGAKREVRATRHHLSEASDLIAEIAKDATS